jgi:simple sugar transport system ATP-binding protein
MMVGRPVRFTVDKKPMAAGAPLLEVKNLRVLNERAEPAVDDVSLTVHAGEIVGIAGVQGNGQTELVEALTGLKPVVGGSVTFLDQDITDATARQCHALGIAHIPEDRQQDGLIETFDIAENMVLDSYYAEPFSSGVRMHWQTVYEETARIVTDFDVRTPSVFTLADHLSGGNQQKLVVARELSRDIKLMIASQPTRGVDVGSIEYIHERLVEARDSGVGVLLVSTELDEIRGLSDRILVMYRGRVVAEFDAATATVSEIGLAMAGAPA